MTRILLVEDDVSIAHVISAALKGENLAVETCTGIAERNRLLAQRSYDLMITDVILQDGDGIESLPIVHQNHPEMPIIILSAQNTLDTAVRASETGAFEYFPKPFDLHELVRAVKQAIGQSRKTVSEDDDSGLGNASLPLVGRSAPMQNVYRMITRVLRNDLSVLVLGESGTGKELVAEAIHSLGHRKDGPFVAVNMAAIPAELIEAELFGHEKGAFTGAVSQRIGKFEQAFGGTLFLDEIGDMPMDAQTRLLRALQSGRISRLGGRREIELDVRIIAATNRALPPMIEAGKFREDLYYRINVVPIEVPPLRERTDDIHALVQHFLKQATDEGLPRRSITDDAVTLLASQSWRGNVRELKNLVYRLAVFSRDDVITREVVSPFLENGKTEIMADASLYNFENAVARYFATSPVTPGQVYASALREFEIPMLMHALAINAHNQLRTADFLGINRNTLRKKLNDYGIDSAKQR